MIMNGFKSGFWAGRGRVSEAARIFCQTVVLSALLSLPPASHCGAEQWLIREDFSEAAPGEVPELPGLGVASGPGMRALVVDETTDPRDPFQIRGNRSLMLENSEHGVTPSASFGIDEDKQAPVRGTFLCRFYLEQGADFRSPSFQFRFPNSGYFTLSRERMVVPDGEGRVTLDNVPNANWANLLVIHFDTEGGTYHGTLNGEPLAITGRHISQLEGSVKQTEKTEFSFSGSVTLDSVRFRPGGTRTTSSRIYIDSVKLALPGATE